MASQYNTGYAVDPVQRAPSPYINEQNNGYAPDSNQASPYAPYQQGSSNSYYDQHPQINDPNLAPAGDPQYNVYPPAEGDRGIIGAIGGGLTGGYVGKQTCHAFLGTVGGAIIGSLTEDWAKKKKPLCGSRPTTPVCEPPVQHCPPPANHQPCHQPQVYSPPIIDTHTTVATATHVHPGYNWQSPPPQYSHPHTKPCGHSHHCGCQLFGKR